MNTLEAKKCEACDSFFDRSLTFCPNCGQKLVVADKILGQMLDGRYRLESVLGRGGMGVVYRATHIHLDTQCAVKVLHPELVSNQAAIERFRREARAAGRIQHPNAIQVTDFGVAQDGVVYLVMEMVQGDTLRDVLKKEKKIAPARAIEWMLQVCAAVHEAHEKGVIHRDLKPDNIILQADSSPERLKVLDFGIAKLRERETSGDSRVLGDAPREFEKTLTEAGMLIGTPQYMSPEQCRAKKLDPRSDIYSLGVIVYEMLGGRLPFIGETPIEVVLKHIKEIPPPLRETNPEITPELERVVMRSLDKEVNNRQTTAAEFGEELRAAVHGAAPAAAVAGKGKKAAAAPAPLDDRKTIVQPRPVSVVQAEQGGAVVKPGVSPSSSVDTTGQSTGGGLPKWLIPAAAAGVVLIAVAAYLMFGGGGAKPVDGGSTPGQRTAQASTEGMVLVEGGTFTMGTNSNDRLIGGKNIDGPAHEVTVKSFYLDKFEVTNQQYKEFVVANNYSPPKNWKYNGSFAPEDANLPVTWVSWNDAFAYASWKKKRLPTEEEWEYAARSGSKNFLYPWGDTYVAGQANVHEGGPKKTKPAPVGTYSKDINAWGIYDLAGNVSEWVQNNFRFYDGRPSDLDLYKVNRGGHFTDKAELATAVIRWADVSDSAADENTLSITGFRCALDAEKK